MVPVDSPHLYPVAAGIVVTAVGQILVGFRCTTVTWVVQMSFGLQQLDHHHRLTNDLQVFFSFFGSLLKKIFISESTVN